MWWGYISFRHTFFFILQKTEIQLTFGKLTGRVLFTKQRQTKELFSQSYCQSCLVRKFNVSNLLESVWMFHILLLCNLKAEHIFIWLMCQVKYLIFIIILFYNNFYLELFKNHKIENPFQWTHESILLQGEFFVWS